MLKRKLKTKEVVKEAGLTRQRLEQLRNGHTKVVGAKKYLYPPALIKGVDWDWENGDVVYFESSLTKLK